MGSDTRPFRRLVDLVTRVLITLSFCSFLRQQKGLKIMAVTGCLHLGILPCKLQLIFQNTDCGNPLKKIPNKSVIKRRLSSKELLKSSIKEKKRRKEKIRE